MEVWDIGLMRPVILPPTVATTMEFWKNKVLKCLWLMKDVEMTLLRPSTLPLVITDFVDIGLLIPATLNLITAVDIIVVMSVEVDLGHKRPVTITL